MPADSKLNEPGARYSRGDAMAAMAERRRETVAKDMEPADYAELTGAPVPTEAVTSTAAPVEGEDASLAPAPARAPAADRDELAAADGRPRERNVFEIANELDAAPAPKPAAPPAPAAPATDELDLTRKLKLKVNGVDVERTLAEVIADAQKVSAADDYLQRSRDQLHSINQLADEVRAKLKSDPPAAAVVPANTTQEDPAAEGVAALFRGDEEGAKTWFRKLVTPAVAPVDPAKVLDLVDQRVTLREARAAFLSAHPDADTNPLTTGAANTALRLELTRLGVADVEALAPDQIRPVFEAASAALTAWRGSKTSSPSPAPAVNRATNKSTIDELPAASARAATQEAPPQTNSSVIAQMRAARPGSAPSSVH